MFKYSTNMQRSLTKCPAAAAAAKLLQSCLNLCDPRDSSPPGSITPGILQARTLEWVAISFSKCPLLSEHLTSIISFNLPLALGRSEA